MGTNTKTHWQISHIVRDFGIISPKWDASFKSLPSEIRKSHRMGSRKSIRASVERNKNERPSKSTWAKILCTLSDWSSIHRACKYLHIYYCFQVSIFRGFLSRANESLIFVPSLELLSFWWWISEVNSFCFIGIYFVILKQKPERVN